MPRKIDLIEAKQKAARFCAYQERSPKEVSDKLKSWGLSSELIEKALAELIEEKFVSAQRFANAYCNDKFEFNSWGKQKIKATIYTHQLESSVIEKALERIDDDKYFDRLVELAKKKWESLNGETEAKRKQKTLSYLSSKGFEVDLIWKAIGQVSK